MGNYWRSELATFLVLVAWADDASSFVALARSGASGSASTSRRELSEDKTKLLALFDRSVYETIQNGQIAVIPDFLPESEIEELKRDAMALHNGNHFTTDALASYGKSGDFDPSKDRAVLKLQQWKNKNLGDWDTRQKFGARIRDVRRDLATNLNRPNLLSGDSVSMYGDGSTEISYTRFGAGAFLKRHVDEHHEELKGVAGWSKPTRRSLSWLIYLNKDWNADTSGGCLRCYERKTKSSNPVGARSNGDLQIGWLRASDNDPVERPVFLDSQHGGGSGNCAMYVDSSSSKDDNDDSSVNTYITKDFNAHPTLFVAGGELLVQKLLMKRKDLAGRFYFIEPPKSRLSDLFLPPRQADEVLADIEPIGGTLVVFDSVALPHEVLATIGRERWATSGWMHEDQQRIDTHPDYYTTRI